MALRNLIHGDGKRTMIPALREESPLASLEHQMNRMMERFFRDAGLVPWSLNRTDAFTPRLNVSETDRAILVTAELPGLEEKDVDVMLTQGALVIKGEKREEREETGAESYRMERSYGAFRRVIPLPSEIDIERVEATFRKGVLRVKLPKIAGEPKEHKKIEIKHEE